MLDLLFACSTYYLLVIYFTALLSSLGMMTGKVMAPLYIGGLRDTALSTRQFVVQESATQADELEEWKETVLIPTLESYSPNDIYNSDEAALIYKSLPHSTYCHANDKPSGSAKHKDRLTLLVITSMDGSDHRKLSVIGKAKTPHCLQKK